MKATVHCPNPRCLHHKVAFSVELTSPIAKKGGNARWAKMSLKERREHIERMMKARKKSPATVARIAKAKAIAKKK